MANIPQPTYILIGDANSNGTYVAGYPFGVGSPAIEFAQNGDGHWNQPVNSWLIATGNAQLWQTVPHEANGSIPAAPAFYPYWDGIFGGVGAFVVFHPVNSTLNAGPFASFPLLSPVPGSHGANWYAGGGFGIETSLMHVLNALHSSAPYFKCCKFVPGDSGFWDLDTNSSAWTALQNGWIPARRAMTNHASTATGGSTTYIDRALTTGTATGGAASRIDGTGWVAQDLVNLTCTITSGTGSGQTRKITSNSTTQAFTDTPWTTVPDNTSHYEFGYEVNEHIDRIAYVSSGPAVGNERTIVSNTRTRITIDSAAPFSGAVANGNTYRVNNTHDIRAVVIDCTRRDITRSMTAPIPDLTNVDNVRNVLDRLLDPAGEWRVPSTAPIVILQPHKSWKADTGAGFTKGMRDILTQIKSEYPQVVLHDWSRYDLATVVPVPQADPDSIGPFGFIQAGYAIGAAINSFYTVGPTNIPDRAGLATYTWGGDSTAVGGFPADQMEIYGPEESLFGPFIDPWNPTTFANRKRTNVWVWDWVAQDIVRYSVMGGDNTGGTIHSGYGPSARALVKLIEEHPEGVLLVKCAANGATLTAEGAAGQPDPTNTFDVSVPGNYTDRLADELNKAMALAITRGVPIGPGVYQRRTVDVRGSFWQLGDNDWWEIGSGTIFRNKLLAHPEQARQRLQSRIAGAEDLAQVYVRPKPPRGTRDPTVPPTNPNGSTHGLPAEREIGRAAFEELLTLNRVRFVDIDGEELERFERRPNNPSGNWTAVHFGWTMNRNVGELCADEMLTIGVLGGSGAGSGDGSDSQDGAGDDSTDGASSGSDSASAIEVPAATSPADIVAIIDAAIASGADVASYTVNGRTVVMRSFDQMLAVRKFYAAEAQRSRGLTRTYARFGR